MAEKLKRDYDKRKREEADKLNRECGLRLNREYDVVELECCKIMNLLNLEAEKRTWELCEELEKQGKLSEENISYLRHVKEAREKKADKFALRCYHLMFYGFTKYGTPYQSLYVMRYKENGEYVPSVLGERQPTRYRCSLEHDLQLLEFGKELKTCGKIKLDRIAQEWKERCSEALEIATKISKNKRFHALDDLDVSDCVNSIVLTALPLCRIDDKEKFCHHFLEEEVQDRSRSKSKKEYEKFLSEMDEQYKLPLGVEGIKCAMKVVFSLGGDTTMMREEAKTITDAQELEEFRSNWLKDKHEVIRAHIAAQREECLTHAIKFVDYVKLKLDWAEEIGIIVKDEITGQYSEKYAECFLRRRMLDEELWKVGCDREPGYTSSLDCNQAMKFAK